jgi:uncharacterized 2Fe-2S/4Fe-4S cluster protein (DUF4445 family)
MRSASGWVHTIVLSPPSLQNNTADADRLMAAVGGVLKKTEIRIDFDLLSELPSLLRAHDFKLKVVALTDGQRAEVVHVEPHAEPIDEALPLAGVAIDLGTTRIVLRLLNLETGASLGESALDNPQLDIGPDILTRIHHAESPHHRHQLSAMVVEGINREVKRLCTDAGLDVDRIFLASVAGNTAMTHLFLGLDPRWMIREPYIPAINRPGVVKAARPGLTFHKGARLMVFPNIGSYFGGDVVSGILATGLHRKTGPCLLVDVGTNAEVVLGNRDWMMACAGAAGPALEGGVARMGMTAGPGVIDRVRIDPQDRSFNVRTIDGGAPKGICGSGVIDLAAQLLGAGMIDIRGKLVPEACGHRYLVRDGVGHVVVVAATESATGTDLVFSQADLDSLVRSKAAMYTILRTLTLTVGLAFEEIEAIYVAGTFGAFIDPVSAITIGMIPDLPRNRYRVAGNTSLSGACQVLMSRRAAAEVDDIRDRLTYLELNVNQEFMNRFSAAKFLPHTDRDRFPSVPCP